MADRKSILVEHLRQFAHTQWERGVDRLKSRPGVLGALARRVSALAQRLGVPAPQEGEDSAPVPASPSPRPPPRAAPGARAPAEPPPVKVAPAPREPSPPREAFAPREPVPPPAVFVTTPPPPPPEPQRSSREPVVEGFFVARVMGEQEARSHHLTEAPPPAEPPRAPHGSIGSLPADYTDDTVLLLPRDPHSLFVSWDIKDSTRQRAAQGLDAPRAVLKLFNDRDVLVATLDIPLESRGFYLGGLKAGQPYRVELHFVSRQGESRRIGRSSNRVWLPPDGPSPDTSVRFLRVPAPAPRAAARVEKPALRTEAEHARDYITWRRVLLPHSAERLEPLLPPREAPASGAPTAPPRTHLHVPRAEGSSEARPRVPVSLAPAPAAPGSSSSERWAWSHGPPGGASELWLSSAGPSGSSEQGASAGGSGGPGGLGGFPSQGPVGGSSELAPAGSRPLEGAAQGFGSWGPAGSSEQQPGGAGSRGAVVQWLGSHGPAGSSEQQPGVSRPVEGAVQWMWVYGPVGSAEQGKAMGSEGPPGSSGQWVWSSGPAGSSEAGFSSQGPAGSSGLGW